VTVRRMYARLEAEPGSVVAGPRTRSRFDLTPREREVLAVLVDGASDDEIARRLGMTTKTASVHVSNIKGKLGVDSRTAAVLEAMRLGLVHRPQD
jgi:DNA-binding CsgD family transcriptional regulator